MGTTFLSLLACSQKVIYWHTPSLSLFLCLSGLKKKTKNKKESEINISLGLFPHLRGILIIPGHDCPKPHPHLERKENKTSRKKIRKWCWKKGALLQMGERWIPLLDVCKCAEKPVFTREQQCAFWCISLCRLQEGEPIFYWGRVTEIYPPGLSSHNYSNL